jgi:hypothetical protein
MQASGNSLRLKSFLETSRVIAAPAKPGIIFDIFISKCNQDKGGNCLMNRDKEYLLKEIKDLRVRMPPHDPSMAMMMEMDELEIQQDDLKSELKALLDK